MNDFCKLLKRCTNLSSASAMYNIFIKLVKYYFIHLILIKMEVLILKNIYCIIILFSVFSILLKDDDENIFKCIFDLI